MYIRVIDSSLLRMTIGSESEREWHLVGDYIELKSVGDCWNEHCHQRNHILLWKKENKFCLHSEKQVSWHFSLHVMAPKMHQIESTKVKKFLKETTKNTDKDSYSWCINKWKYLQCKRKLCLILYILYKILPVFFIFIPKESVVLQKSCYSFCWSCRLFFLI